VFVNACRSAGASPGLHDLDGWANKFIQAGAGAFIGSLWAIRDAAAREFASVLYDHLRYQFTLGRAVMAARAAAALGNGDPTWLAYAVYGDPRASAR
jgi:CHAT domain-containing protein